MAEQKKKLIIIDSNSVIHRAFHALPALSTKKGELVNAVYGFLLLFFKTIKEFQPDYIAACFDFPAPTFRHKKFKGYKAKRKPAPKELYSQIPKVKEVLKAFNVSIFEKQGFEADDIIGTIAKKFPKKQVFPEVEVIILSGDLDTLQLVDKNIRVYLLRKGVKNTVLYNERLVKEKYLGLNPQQLVDFRALRGDPSDNIPGVTGIGEKTAINLLKEFGTLDNIYNQLEQRTKGFKSLKPKTKELLIQQKEQAFFSKDLAKIEENVPIDFNPNKIQWGKYNREKIVKVLKNLEFQSLIKRLPQREEKAETKGKNLKLW